MWKGSYMSQRIQNNAKRKVIFIPLGKSKWKDTIEVRNFFFFAILMFHSTRKGTFWWKIFRKHLNMWRKGLAYELAFIGVEFEVTCWETGGIFKEKINCYPLWFIQLFGGLLVHLECQVALIYSKSQFFNI